MIEALATAPGALDSSEQVAAGELVEKLLARLRPPDRLAHAPHVPGGTKCGGNLEADRLEPRGGEGARVSGLAVRWRKHYQSLMKETL